MIQKLSKLKYWELAALGVSLIVISSLLYMFAVRFINGTWPQTNEASHIAYIVVSTFTAWVISGVFVEAGFTKWRRAEIDRVMDQIATGRHRAEADCG